MDKPHLLLDWHMDCNTGKLTCTLLDGALVYEAHQGGLNGYTKTYNGKVTKLINKSKDWKKEKYWISENWGEKYGYYQPDHEREELEKSTGEMEGRIEGLGAEGEYIDHLHRSKFLLDGLDCAPIYDEGYNRLHRDHPKPEFCTPDKGLTIYKKLPTTKTFYFDDQAQETFDYENPAFDGKLQWHGSMPCQMLPFIKSYILSSHEEMSLAGVSGGVIGVCKNGEWAEPERPELQKHFTYPTKNTFNLTKENVNKLDNG